MSWAWLGLKRIGFIIRARWGGASEAEKDRFREKWDKKCVQCQVHRWDHAAQNHNFVEPKGDK